MIGSNSIHLQTTRAQFHFRFKMEDSDSDSDLLKDPLFCREGKGVFPKKVESEHFRKKTQPERESSQANRCIFKQEQQEAVLDWA